MHGHLQLNIMHAMFLISGKHRVETKMTGDI